MPVTNTDFNAPAPCPTSPVLRRTDATPRAAGKPDRHSGRWHARRWILGLTGGIVGLLAVVAATGATFETISGLGDASAYPAAGRLVDVGGYRLHLDCHGEGGPTIVMDAGLGGSSLDWMFVQPALATTNRVCVYDRAGMGWSDPGPAPRSPAHIAEELHLLLENADVSGPYVLVAHSLAGKAARLFAAAHPEQVVGMVLVDTRSESVDAQTSVEEANAFSVALKMQAAIYSAARRLGIARLFGAALVDMPLPAQVAAEMVLLQTQPTAIDATTQEGMARSADDDALASSTLGSMPVVVVAADQSIGTIPHWAEAQNALASLSTDGRLVVARNSGHSVQFEHPDVVIEGVRDVLARIRQGS